MARCKTGWKNNILDKFLTALRDHGEGHTARRAVVHLDKAPLMALSRTPPNAFLKGFATLEIFSVARLRASFAMLRKSSYAA